MSLDADEGGPEHTRVTLRAEPQQRRGAGAATFVPVDDDRELVAVEVLSDDSGVAVFGEAGAVKAFLQSHGLWAASDAFDVERFRRTVAQAGETVEVLSGVARGAGRWLKLTPESAAKLKKTGLIDTDVPGIRHAVVGRRGQIDSWLQVEGGLGSLLANPDVMTSVATAMAQAAIRHAIEEIGTYLKQIDATLGEVYRKLDDVQRSKLVAAANGIHSAMSELDGQGFVSDQTWPTITSAGEAIESVQSYALQQLGALAALLSVDDVTELDTVLLRHSAEADEWIHVLAFCSQQLHRFHVLKLDRHRQDGRDDLNFQRDSTVTTLRERREDVLGGTDDLLAALHRANRYATGQRVRHRADAESTIRETERIAGAVSELRQVLEADADVRDWELIELTALHNGASRTIQVTRDHGTKAAMGSALAAAPKVLPKVLPKAAQLLKNLR